MLPNFTYVRVFKLEDAVKHLSTDGARIMAGGTDLLGCLRDEVFDAKKIVSINQVESLRQISQNGDGSIRMGALVGISEIASNDLIADYYRALSQAAAEVASPQLRNQGTIGGNICQKPRCWYYRGEFHCRRKGGAMCYAMGGENHFHAIFGTGGKCAVVNPSDTAPALIAFGAQVRMLGPAGPRTALLENFYVSPAEDVERETILQQGEIVTDIFLPPPSENLKSSYRKIRARRSWDFAVAGVALAVEFNERTIVRSRVILSGAAPIPWRSTDAEKVLAGRELNPTVIREAAETTVKGARTLRHNEYKIPMFKALMEEELFKMTVELRKS